WPTDLQDAMRSAVTQAVAFQRGLHVQEEKDARKAIEAQGCEIVELSAAEHDAFVAAVEPLLNEARATFGQRLLDLTASTAAGCVESCNSRSSPRKRGPRFEMTKTGFPA